MQLELVSKHPMTVWGFDIEWFVSYERGPQRQVALIQFHRHCDTLLYHVSACGVCEDLRKLLEAANVFKVGVSVSGDKCKLERDLGVRMRGCVDLRTLYERCLPSVELARQQTSGRGLASMVTDYLQRSMDKPESLRRSNWEEPLSRAQKLYAALDAFAGFALWDFLCQADVPLSLPAGGEEEKHSCSGDDENNHARLRFGLPRLLHELSLPPAQPQYASSVGKMSSDHAIDVLPGLDAAESAAAAASNNNSSDVIRIERVTTRIDLGETPCHPLPWTSIPVPLVDLLASYELAILETTLVPATRMPPAKASTLHVFNMGVLSIDDIAAARGIQSSTVVSYVLECITIGGAPYRYVCFRLDAATRDLAICACVNYYHACPPKNAEQGGPKSRGELFDIVKSVASTAPPNVTVNQLSIVDAHLFRVTGKRYWESLFVTRVEMS